MAVPFAVASRSGYVRDNSEAVRARSDGRRIRPSKITPHVTRHKAITHAMPACWLATVKKSLVTALSRSRSGNAHANDVDVSDEQARYPTSWRRLAW